MPKELELPSNPYSPQPGWDGVSEMLLPSGELLDGPAVRQREIGYREAQQDMLKAGWVKETK